MYLLNDTQQAGNWLFKVISENGITTVLAVLFIIHVVFDILAFSKEWVVTGEASRRKDQQIEASNVVLAAQIQQSNAALAAQEESRVSKVEARLEKVEDSQRDILNKQENILEA